MENNELVIQEDVLPAIGDDTLIALAEQAEKRIDAMNKIKNIALRLTNKHDWVDQNGKPYLQASGAEKIGRMFGISWQISEPIFEGEEGGHFNYTYKGTFSLVGASIEAIGTRSSKDGFFRKYSYPKGQDRVELPPSEIDKGDVKKSAYTNLLANGITRLLGIRNLTYDDLNQFAQIRKDDMARVEYKKGTQKQSESKVSQKATVNTENGNQVNIGSIRAALAKKGYVTEDEQKSMLLIKDWKELNDLEGAMALANDLDCEGRY